jgi:hypothetical protein
LPVGVTPAQEYGVQTVRCRRPRNEMQASAFQIEFGHSFEPPVACTLGFLFSLGVGSLRKNDVLGVTDL